MVLRRPPGQVVVLRRPPTTHCGDRQRSCRRPSCRPCRRRPCRRPWQHADGRGRGRYARGTCSSCGACTTGTWCHRRTMCSRLRRQAAAAAAAAPVMAAAAVAGASAGCAATLSGNLRRSPELLGVVGGTIVVDATLARCRCDGSLGPQSGCLLGRFDFVVVCEACANGRYFLVPLVRSVAPRTTHLSGVSDALRCVHSCESQGSAGFRTRHPETFRTAPLQSFREAQRPALPARNPAAGPSATSSAPLRHRQQA